MVTCSSINADCGFRMQFFLHTLQKEVTGGGGGIGGGIGGIGGTGIGGGGIGGIDGIGGGTGPSGPSSNYGPPGASGPY